MTPAQSKAARAMLDITQPMLAHKAAVGLSTVVDFERNRREVSAHSIAAMRTALELAGIQFIEENGGGAGIRIKKGK